MLVGYRGWKKSYQDIRCCEIQTHLARLAEESKLGADEDLVTVSLASALHRAEVKTKLTDVP